MSSSWFQNIFSYHRDPKIYFYHLGFKIYPQPPLPANIARLRRFWRSSVWWLEATMNKKFEIKSKWQNLVVESHNLATCRPRFHHLQIHLQNVSKVNISHDWYPRFELNLYHVVFIHLQTVSFWIEVKLALPKSPWQYNNQHVSCTRVKTHQE